MKNVTIIGVGKLGICLALNLEKNGYNIMGVDINKNYIDSINNKTLKSSEPKVSELLINSNNFYTTTNIADGVNFSNIIFILVSTPSLKDGKYDHSQIENVLNEIKKLGKQESKKTLVIGCTTYPGYCEGLVEDLNTLNYSLVYNPEFIAQGNIIHGQEYPDLVLIGESEKTAGDIIQKIHEDITKSSPKIHRMSLTESELTKLSINCFITTKISFANMIGDLCNKLNISHENVLGSIGSDSRIGSKYLSWGFGFGGPCFPRDNRALGILCSENNIDPQIPSASDNYNKLHNHYHAQFLIDKKIKNNKFVLEGASYKKGSVLIEESQQLVVADLIKKQGVWVLIKDREEVIDQVKKINGNKYDYEREQN